MQRFARHDDWLFRFRWYVPALLIPPALIAAAQAGEFERGLSRGFENGWQAFCLLLALSGVAIRALAVASLPAAGAATELAGETLPSTGAYSVVRYPHYFGTYVSLLGLSLVPGALWFVAVVSVGFFLWYGRIVARNEAALEERFGDAYRDWARRIPLFLPNPFLWKRGEGPVSLVTALRRESNAFYLVVAGFTFFELSSDLLGERMSLKAWLVEDAHWALFFLVGTLITITLRVLAAPAELAEGVRLEAGEIAGPATLGIRVDGRQRSVDILENLISVGNLDAILRATLKAAVLRGGERLVDVGCGTGRLAITAAMHLIDDRPLGDIVGIDATPGMIAIARRRAHEAGVSIDFRVGAAEDLPLPDGFAHAVTSSYLFHHLPSEVKRAALLDMWRLLAPGGRLIITDYSTPVGVLGQIAAFPMRFNTYEYVRGQLAGELQRIIEAEGLGPIEEVRVFLGYIRVLRLVKPAAAPGGSADNTADRTIA